MADTQAVGLGFLILRRWRGGTANAHPVTSIRGSTPSPAPKVRTIPDWGTAPGLAHK